MASANEEKSLYARIGGYDTIAALVDEFLTTLANDPSMGRFAAGMNLERRQRNRQLTLDFIAAASGGPTLYLGQNMKTAHAGLAISAAEWQISLDHIRRALAKFKVPDRESKELVALIDDLAKEIVER